MNATIEFNSVTDTYECVTEFYRYQQVHVSRDCGLFQRETAESVICVICARGEAREVTCGDEREIDGVTYVATVSGWKEVE